MSLRTVHPSPSLRQSRLDIARCATPRPSPIRREHRGAGQSGDAASSTSGRPSSRSGALFPVPTRQVHETKSPPHKETDGDPQARRPHKSSGASCTVLVRRGRGPDRRRAPRAATPPKGAERAGGGPRSHRTSLATVSSWARARAGDRVYAHSLGPGAGQPLPRAVGRQRPSATWHRARSRWLRRGSVGGPGSADPYGPRASARVDGRAVRGPGGPRTQAERAPRAPGGARRRRRALDELEPGDEVTLVVGAEREGLPAAVVAAACDEVAHIADPLDS